jgi:hypothetical protein
MPEREPAEPDLRRADGERQCERVPAARPAARAPTPVDEVPVCDNSRPRRGRRRPRSTDAPKRSATSGNSEKMDLSLYCPVR